METSSVNGTVAGTLVMEVTITQQSQVRWVGIIGGQLGQGKDRPLHLGILSSGKQMIQTHFILTTPATNPLRAYPNVMWLLDKTPGRIRMWVDQQRLDVSRARLLT